MVLDKGIMEEDGNSMGVRAAQFRCSIEIVVRNVDILASMVGFLKEEDIRLEVREGRKEVRELKIKMVYIEGGDGQLRRLRWRARLGALSFGKGHGDVGTSNRVMSKGRKGVKSSL